MSRAVVYLRDAKWMRPCVDYCQAREHEIVAVVLDPEGTYWASVEATLADGDADVAVVADRGQIPPHPRVEAVVEQSEGRPNLMPVLRRPKVLPRVNSIPRPAIRFRPNRRYGMGGETR